MVLTNRQYQELKYKYEERQLRSKYILSERTEEVYNIIPQIKELDNKLRSLSLEFAKSSLMKNDENKQENNLNYEREIDNISKEKEKFLSEFGYAKDYLQPIYECQDCKDTGYIGDKKCHCFEKMIVSYLYKMSNIEEKLEKENFDTFDLESYSRDKESSKESC